MIRTTVMHTCKYHLSHKKCPYSFAIWFSPSHKAQYIVDTFLIFARTSTSQLWSLCSCLSYGHVRFILTTLLLIDTWVLSKCFINISKSHNEHFFFIHPFTSCGYVLRISSRKWNCWAKTAKKGFKSRLWKDGAHSTSLGQVPSSSVLTLGSRYSVPVPWPQHTRLLHSGQQSDSGGLQWNPGAWIFKHTCSWF